jgi:hypothetical protein
MARIARTNKIIVRLTDKEKERLENYAVTLGVSMSEVIQDYIKSLPDANIGNSSTILRPVKHKFNSVEDVLVITPSYPHPTS